MDEKDMKAFIALYEKKSLRQAANDLFITPQGLSRILQKIENEYGCPLFRRTKQGLISTETGDYLYMEARKLLNRYSSIRHNINTLSKQRKEINLVCSYGTMGSLPYEKFVEFQKKHANQLRIRWREFPDKLAMASLMNNEYSIGLIVTKKEDVRKDYIVRELYSESIVVLVYEGHPFYEKDSIRIEDLKGEALIMEGDDFWIYEYFKGKCSAKGFSPNIIIETGDITFCHKLCTLRQGLGISVGFVSEFINADRIKVIPIEGEEKAWPVSLVYHKNTVFRESDQLFFEFLNEIRKQHKKA